jgi:hypothetical protein
MQHVLNNCSSFRKILIILSTEEAEWCIFYSWWETANLRKYEVRTHEKRQIDLHFCFIGRLDFMLLQNQLWYCWCFGTCEYARCLCTYEPYIHVSFPSAWPLNGTMAYSDTEC